MNAAPNPYSANPAARLRLRLRLQILALAIAGLPGMVHAGDVPAGGTHTVNAGDPVDNWTVATGGSLIVSPGAQTMGIFANEPAQIAVTSGQVESTATAIAIAISGTVNIGANSVLRGQNGITLIADVANGIQLDMADSMIETNYTALFLRNASARLTNTKTQSPLNGAILQGTAVLELDRSQMQTSGTVLLIDASSQPVQLQTINIRNGSQLVGSELLRVDAPFQTVTFNVEDSQMSGDISVIQDALVRAELSNATWQGTANNLTSLALRNGAQWTLTGDSSIQTSTLDGGSIILGDGTRFNTLNVTANLLSTAVGGHLVFNTVLGGDASQTDRIIVARINDGDFRVSVNNAGGTGAATVEGIRLIEANGDSQGRYVLEGRVVAGTHEYLLHKGAVSNPDDGHWYLRSTASDPCDIDPALPECLPVDPDPDPDPEPVLRPEPGAYLANQAAAAQMFNVRLQDRMGAQDRAAWARMGTQQLRYGVVGRQLRVNGDTHVFQAGTDLLRFGQGDNLRMGLMAGSGRSDNRVTSRLDGYQATGRVTGTSGGIYATWQQHPEQRSGAWLDSWAQYARFRNRVNGEDLPEERYDSRQTEVSLEAGYRLQLAEWPRTAVMLEPQLQLTWADARQSEHREANGTRVRRADGSQLGTRAGVRLSGRPLAIEGNRVEPFAELHWLHGGDENAMYFNDERLEGALPQNRYELRAGAQIRYAGRWSAWGDMGVQRGQDGFREVTAQLGLRANW